MRGFRALAAPMMRSRRRSDLGLTDEELRLLQQIVDVHDGIRALGLRTNVAEFTHAVHTLQMFLINRRLHRERPDYWASWFHEAWLPRKMAALRVAIRRARRRWRARA
jgi:hypothetical protein